MILDEQTRKALELGRSYIQERLDCTKLLNETFGGKETDFDKMQRENIEQMLVGLVTLSGVPGWLPAAGATSSVKSR